MAIQRHTFATAGGPAAMNTAARLTAPEAAAEMAWVEMMAAFTVAVPTADAAMVLDVFRTKVAAPVAPADIGRLKVAARVRFAVPSAEAAIVRA